MKAGELMYVREAWGLHVRGDETDWERGSVQGCTEDDIRSQYVLALRADWGPQQESCRWRPGIHMPRWASRISLEIVSVTEEKLHDMNEVEAMREGAEPVITTRRVYPSSQAAVVEEKNYLAGFRKLWDELNGKRCPWASNPTVRRIAFKKVDAIPADAKAHQILFSAPMVRAILANKKLVTRRLVKEK